MFGMLKIYMLIVVVGLVGGVVYAGYYYYKDTQSRIQTLTENNAKLETAKAIQDQTIETLIADREKFDKLNKELQVKLEKANDYKNTLIDKLRKHDLSKLSLKKPGLVEKKINNGTKKLFRSLESLTGATPPAPIVK
jgi:Na+-transporting NADH:ubiquinone oxidoreductase subunit NqrC